jgi:hypothetical protein
MFSKKKRTTSERRSLAPRSTVRSNTVFSYHANRAVRAGESQYRDAEREERQAEAARLGRKHQSWLKRTSNVAVLLAILMVAAFCLQLNSKAKVVPVGTNESQKLFLRDKQVYSEAAQKAFTPWANSNKLTVNAQKVANDLKRQFPELQEVSVSLPVIGNRPVVYIQPAVPQLMLMAQNGVFILDGNGRALISGNQVPQLSRLQIPSVSDQSGLSIQSGQIALPRAIVYFITEVTGQLKAKKVPIVSLTLPPGTNELHVKLDGTGYFVKFNLHGHARAEVGTFLATKQYLEQQHKVPREYIDVRVENKAFYK